MSKLHEIQAAFLHDIYSGENTSEKYINLDITPASRLRIYQNNTLYGLADVLSNAYPVVKKIVGEDFFLSLARHYMAKYHQNEGNRHQFGHQLADFLSSYGPAKPLVYLPDVARIEWAVFKASLAEDVSTLSFEELARNIQTNEHYALTLHPGSSRLSLKYNALDIFQAHQKEPVEKIELKEYPHELLIFRAIDHEICFVEQSLELALLLEASEENLPMAIAFERAVNDQSKVPGLQQAFAGLMANGLFINRSEPLHLFPHNAFKS